MDDRLMFKEKKDMVTYLLQGLDQLLEVILGWHALHRGQGLARIALLDAQKHLVLDARASVVVISAAQRIFAEQEEKKS